MTTLRQLRFLVALDEETNFSRAARLCHVTQSTLSTGLKELEKSLGVMVAERSKQSVMMTPIGQELADRARTILAQVQDFEDRAASETDAGMSRVRLGIIPTVGPYLMPRAMPLLKAALPKTKFYLREELTEPLVDSLINGRLDLLLIALPHLLPPEIETEILFSDGYWLATPIDHALGNSGSVGAEDLRNRELLLLEKGHCLQRHALSSFSGINLDEDQSFSATSLPTLVAMVEEDLGITLLPKLAVDAGISEGHNLHLSDVDGACPRQVVLAWRKSTPDLAVFQKVRNCLLEARREVSQRRRSNLKTS